MFMWPLFMRFPVLLPVSMVALNVLTTATRFQDGKNVAKTATYAVLYAMSIPAAVRGDLQPFFTVFTTPLP